MTANAATARTRKDVLGAISKYRPRRGTYAGVAALGARAQQIEYVVASATK
jgi:hypothetical protein